MEQTNNTGHLLNLLTRPAFCVSDGIVVRVNRGARQKQITEGTQISELLPAALDAYRTFSGGCLYLPVTTAGIMCCASVTRTEDGDIFVLDDETDAAQLEALSLAAQQLRIPLSNIMTVMQMLFSQQPTDDPKVKAQSAQVSRGLNQLHRIISNMADTAYYGKDAVPMETLDLGAIFDEAMEKAAALVADAGITLHFTGLRQAIFGLANSQMLERAVFNLISNAVKFSPKGSTLEARLSQNGSMLCFCLQDKGQGIGPEILGSVFTRYLRQPGIEDGRHGIGLGLALVRSAATAHGGTVLIDQPDSTGTRVCMSVAIRQPDNHDLHSPVLRISDYAGGRDHGLLELSDILPAQSYQDELL